MAGVVALALVWACQSVPLVESVDGFYHTRQRWRIDAPARAGDGVDAGASAAVWRRVSVPDSLLAYRFQVAGGAAWMTLSSRCRVSLAPPRLLARHLRIGIPEHTVRAAAPVDVGGTPGWVQRFDAIEDGAVVRVKTVTAVVEGCALDWVLSVGGAGDFEAAERDFDAWWQSFRPASEPAAGKEES